MTSGVGASSAGLACLVPRLHWAQGRALGVCNIRAGYSPSPGVLSANQGPSDPGPPPVSAPVSSLGWWLAPTPGRSVPRGFAAVGEVSAFLTLSHSCSSSWRGPRELRRGATCPAADHGQDRTAVWDGDGSWAYPSSHSPTGCGQRAAAACRRTWGHEDWGAGGPVGAGWRRAMPLTRPLLPAAWSTTFGSRRAASSGC